jgi:isochorismate hydrolase
MRMNRAHSQLLLIDMQVKLLPAIHASDSVLAGCTKLAHYAQRLDVPVTISEQYPRGLGGTVTSLREPAGAEATVLEKVEFSCQSNPTLNSHIWQHRAAGRHHIIVGGIEAHVCVLQTVLELVAEGADVFVVADAVGSRAPSSRDLALARMAQAGAKIVDTEMVMFEWLERAGTPEFKELQATLK